MINVPGNMLGVVLFVVVYCAFLVLSFWINFFLTKAVLYVFGKQITITNRVKYPKIKDLPDQKGLAKR